MPDAPLVKVCGLTDPAEAAACAELGAWAIGLVFAPESPRVVSVERALAVVQAVPDTVRRFGVFVRLDPVDAAEIAALCRLTHLQVHDPDTDFGLLRAATGCSVVQGVSIDGPAALDVARGSAADLVLLDASVPGRHGGTGQRFDWSLLEAAELGRPFMLAGGLDPGNVAEAVRRLRPPIVDVSSGVERAPGSKDPERVRAFIAATRDAVVAA